MISHDDIQGPLMAQVSHAASGVGTVVSAMPSSGGLPGGRKTVKAGLYVCLARYA